MPTETDRVGLRRQSPSEHPAVKETESEQRQRDRETGPERGERKESRKTRDRQTQGDTQRIEIEADTDSET